MTSLRFRTKLLLAMVPLVAGVTVTALLIMQFYVLDTYKKQFRNLFEYQIDEFIRQRDARLAPIEQRLGKAAANPRLIAAMENAVAAGAAKEDVDDLYLNGWDLLREQVLTARSGGASRLSLQQREWLDKVTESRPELKKEPLFFLFLDKNGGLVRPSTGVLATLAFHFPEVPPAQLKALGQAVTSAGVPLAGFLAPRLELDKTRLREVVCCPVIDRAQNHVLGAVAVGFPLPDEEEKERLELSQALVSALRAAERPGLPPPGPLLHTARPGGILSGIWLDGQLYSATIPEAFQNTLQSSLAGELKKPADERSFNALLTGVSHQVSWRLMNANSAFPPAYQVCLFSLAPVEKQQRDLLVWITLVGLLALLAALGLSFVISHGLSVPLKELVTGTTEIERGNYLVKVPVRSRDEIGQLANAFNDMAGGLALKERYRSVLNMVADKGVAEQMISGQLALGGEMREISVLFCDIRGFTAMSQDMPPTEVIEMLNTHMTALTKVVYECDGVVDKFVGDLIMALFGAPKSSGQDALNAARCALRMIEARRRENETGRHQVAMGIGIATGQAVAGCMGSADRLNYTVLGERVNLAARLCSTAGRMEVVIDQTTREKLGDLAEVEAMPELKLKGFSSAVTAYKLKAIKHPETTA